MSKSDRKERFNDLLIGISKHMIAISLAIIAGLVSYIKTSSGLSLMWTFNISMIMAAGVAISSILVQVAILSRLAGDEKKTKIPDNPMFYYYVSWILFMLSGLSGSYFVLQNV